MSSRHIAFKAAKMSEALSETQSSFIFRNVVGEKITLDQEFMEDLCRS